MLPAKHASVVGKGLSESMPAVDQDADKVLLSRSLVVRTHFNWQEMCIAVY
jgi:hypothetical protein